MLNTKTMLANISKGQSAIPLKYIIAGLEQDYATLAPITILQYIDNTKPDKITIYYHSPSSTFPNLYYDVDFEFYMRHDLNSKITTSTEFKVYCNSPSFYFRYANIFRQHNSLLFQSKYPSMVDVSPDIRNPSKTTGFDKYVYTCLRLSMMDVIGNMMTKMKDKFAPTVKSFNEKRFEYIKAAKLAKVEKEEVDRGIRD